MLPDIAVKNTFVTLRMVTRPVLLFYLFFKLNRWCSLTCTFNLSCHQL